MEYSKKDKIVAFSVALLPESLALFVLFVVVEIGYQLLIKFGDGDPRLSLIFLIFGSALSTLMLFYRTFLFYIKNGWSFKIENKLNNHRQ